MLENTLKVVLVLQIILRALIATDRKSSSEVVSNTSSQGKVEANNNVHFDDERELSNGDGTQNVQLNDGTPYGKIQDLKNQDNLKSLNMEQEKNKKMKFVYAVDKKDTAGFDLTPEEMKKFKIWKDGVIPYYIDVVSFSDKVLRDKIRNFLQMVNSVTSINFVELPGPPSSDTERWVFFLNRRGLLGCADHTVKNFTNQGVQQVVLGYDCIATRGEIAEAVMSIVGVSAQHNAPDRDKYIKINLENVMPDKKYLFEKLNDNDWLFHDLPYDFNSVTHYDIHKYSANGRATIELKEDSENLNPATEFSATDLQKIKLLYNFITRNKKMQKPVCEKLFKISSNFKPGPSESKRIKLKRKPSRYMGIADPGAGEFDKNTADKPNESTDENKDQNEDNEANVQKLTQDEILTDEDENQDNENKENETLVTDTINKNRLKGKPKEKVNLLQMFSDYDSNEEVKRVAMKYKPKKPAIDLLSVLSDYQTDDGRG